MFSSPQRVNGGSIRVAVTILCLGAISLGMSCAALDAAERRADTSPVIGFDLSTIGDDGLRGRASGKVAVSYEFKIPATEKHIAEVRSIDGTIQFMRASRGRVGAGPGECLCIGSTHQRNFRTVLRRLAALPYITRIIECHWE